MIHPPLCRGLIAILATAWLTLPGNAETPNLRPALAQLQNYHFGQDRGAVDAIESVVFAAQSDPTTRPAVARQLAEFLHNTAPHDARQFVCRQLVLVATENEIPTLSALLRDPELSALALHVLNRLPDPAVDEVLRRALPETTDLTRLGIVELLGRRRDARAVPLLIPLLQGEDEATVSTAASALGSIASVEASQALEAAWAAVAPAPRPDLAEALFQTTTRLLADNRPAQAVRIFTRIGELTHDPHLQAAAFRGRVLADLQSSSTLLEEALRDPGSDRQVLAATCVRELPPSFDFSSLVIALPDLPVSSQILLIQAFSDRQLATARAPVQSLLQSSDPQLRLVCLEALGNLGDLDSLDLLIQHASSAPAAERQAALASLATLPGSDVDLQLTLRLKASTTATRIVALESLGQRNAVGALPAILLAASDPNPAVRQPAHSVLRELASPTSIRAIMDQLLAAPPPQRGPWVATLGAAIDKMPLDDARTTDIVAALESTQDPGLRADLLTALGQTGVHAALPNLESALEDPASEVRLAALRQLADWPDGTPLIHLRKTVADSRNTQEHTLALRGMIRQIALPPERTPGQRLQLYQAAMDSARAIPERRLVLSGLASLPTLEALRYARGFTEEAELRAEAELALAAIARGTAGAWPEETRLALRPLAASGANPTAQTQAAEVLRLLDQLTGFVTTWEVSPSYAREGLSCAQLFDAPFAPEQETTAVAVAWQPMPALTHPEQPWLLDLLALHGGEQRVAYLRTLLLSDHAREVLLELGSDDGVKVWLNGTVVWANNTQRAVAPAQDSVPIALQTGPNLFLVKVTQNVMGWGLCARILNADGSPAEGIRALPPSAASPRRVP